MMPERWAQLQEVALWTTQPFAVPNTDDAATVIRQMGELLREALAEVVPESQGSGS